MCNLEKQVKFQQKCIKDTCSRNYQNSPLPLHYLSLFESKVAHVSIHYSVSHIYIYDITIQIFNLPGLRVRIGIVIPFHVFLLTFY